MKTLDAVVPVYNEQAILPELNRRLVDALGTLPFEWRVIYVDDGSRDRTPELLAGLIKTGALDLIYAHIGSLSNLQDGLLAKKAGANL